MTKRQNGHERDKRFRELVFKEQGGRCYWCGAQMTMPVHVKHQAHPRTTATIDHLDSRLSDTRGAFTGQRVRRRVLACIDCNEKRAAAEVAALPLTELWMRSGSFPTGELYAGQTRTA